MDFHGLKSGLIHEVRVKEPLRSSCISRLSVCVGGAGVEMRLPGTVRARGVGAQPQGGASCLLETRGSHRAVAGGLGKGLRENPQRSVQPKVLPVDFRLPLAAIAQSN